VKLKVGLKTVDTHAIADVNALLDCGATNLFINCAFVWKKEIHTHKLQDPITVYNIDGTVNRGGSITEEVTLIMSHQDHKERAVFEVCDLGKNDLIIGFTWLKKHNPEIDWRTGEVQMTCCPRECNVFARQLKKVKKVKREKNSTWKYSVTIEEVPDEDMPNGDSLIMIEEDDQKGLFQFIHGGQSWDPNPPMVDKPVEELVPKTYHDYLSVFQKKESERMLLRKPWDHGIELKPGFVPKKSKVYLLSPQEQIEVDSFLNKQLQKGYIHPSKSPQTSPIFFQPKKDLKKCMCTDYHYLNEGTVWNAYPLPLISEIIDKVGKAKVFTKLDL
jgi:Retroviral aspartyl protease